MDKLLEGLNAEQLKAVTHQSEGPLLIVAGAGTGKTTVITRRISYLIEQQSALPNEILALTFTEKAAGEMEERVDQLLPLGNYDLWISTFHSFCQRILEAHSLDIGLSNDFRLLNDTQQWILIKKNFEQFKLDYYKPLGNPNKFIGALINHFSKCKDEMITPEEYQAYAQNLKTSVAESSSDEELLEVKKTEEVAAAFAVYQQLLHDNEYLDFGDLINQTIRLFEQRPNVLKKYQLQFKHILVDEFQDTNYAQYKLIQLLTSGKSLPHRTQLVVVGDDDQSIYKFRGASVSNILKLEQDYSDITQITLIQNYRSAQNILDLAYNFIQNNNPNRLEEKLKINKKLISHSKTEGVIEVIEAEDLSSEINAVVNKIVDLKSKDLELTWNDFAILIRANSAAEEVLPKLDNAKIPYTYLANRGLYKKPLIQDIIAYFKLLDNYHESQALLRILNLPEFRISPYELSIITEQSLMKTQSLYETLKSISDSGQESIQENITEESKKKISNLITHIHAHSEYVSEKTAAELFITIIEELGIINRLQEDNAFNNEAREHLDQFYKKILNFEEQNDDKSLRSFIDTLNLELEAGELGQINFDPNSGPETLKIMTVHSSKGLEFKNVFLINMVDQRFPTRKKSDPIEIPESLVKDILPEGDVHLQEERRLFYVALTRAKEGLYLSWSKDYGGTRAKKPSIFLEETSLVPSEKINRATGKVVFKQPASLPNQPVYKRIPARFSFSDITAFENCPLEYKYKYYLKLPGRGAPALSFGKTIHRVLQEMGGDFLPEGKQKLDLAKVNQWYEKYWIDEWYETKEQKNAYKASGLAMLENTYADFTAHKPNIKFIEEPFKLNLGDDVLVGRLDRADIDANGDLVIIDYKTNESPKTKSKRDVDQLLLYQWAAEDVFGMKTSNLIYWYLKDNKKIELEPANSEKLEGLKASVKDTISKIKDTIKYDLFIEAHKTAKQHNCRYENLL